MLSKLSTIINDLIELKKVNKNTTTLLNEFNNLILMLNKDPNKLDILKSLYKKKNKNNTDFFY